MPHSPDSPDEDPALTEPWGDMMERAMDNPIAPMDKWKPSAHTAAVKSIVQGCRALAGWKRVRKRQVGRYIATDANGNPRKIAGKWVYVKVAIKGDPDVSMLWKPPGAKRAFGVEIEAKTGSGKLGQNQKDARDDLMAGGVFHIVAADGSEAVVECQKIAEYVRNHG